MRSFQTSFHFSIRGLVFELPKRNPRGGWPFPGVKAHFATQLAFIRPRPRRRLEMSWVQTLAAVVRHSSLPVRRIAGEGPKQEIWHRLEIEQVLLITCLFQYRLAYETAV
jgi:hypothetical protein